MAFKMKGYSPFTKMDVIHYTDGGAKKVTYEEGVNLMKQQKHVKFTGADLRKALNDPDITEFAALNQDEKTRILSMDDEQRKNQEERDMMQKTIREKNKKTPSTYNPEPK